MAGVEIVPGVEDTDDGFVFVVFGGETHLFDAGAVAEGAEVIGAKPSMAAELVGRFSE